MASAVLIEVIITVGVAGVVLSMITVVILETVCVVCVITALLVVLSSGVFDVIMFVIIAAAVALGAMTAVREAVTVFGMITVLYDKVANV